MRTPMNRYVFVSFGDDTSSADLEQAWHDRFAMRADSFVDADHPFGRGRRLTPTSASDLTAVGSRAAGYSIVQAASLRDAERLLERCPIVGSCHVYETIAV